MKRRNLILTGIAAALVSSCSSKSKFKTYRGPEVTFIVVNKSERKMFLFHKNSVLKEYDFDLGFAPIGDKFYEGDGRTPEGTYFIDRRNPTVNTIFRLVSHTPMLEIGQKLRRLASHQVEISLSTGNQIASNWEKTIGLGDALLCRTAKWKRSTRWSKTAHRLR